MKQHYLFANLIYNSPSCGPLYSNLWLENQLKSLLDQTNLPAIRDKYTLEAVIFTDDETMIHLSRHPNFMALSAICEISIIKVNWPPDIDRFGARYNLLAEIFRQTMQAVFNPQDVRRRNAIVSVLVADLVFAKGAIPKMLSHIEAGYDSVLMVPIRGAADSISPVLQQMPGAPDANALFELTYQNLHHLWTHSTWGNPYFSKFPYSMLWNSGTGLVAHNFGITPIMFKPNEDMLKVQGVIDADVPSFCKNPYWAEDWIDAPVAGVEPLSNGHYPAFNNPHQAADVDWVASWAKQSTHPVQSSYLDKPLYYPSRARFNDTRLASQAQEIALAIQEKTKR